MVIQILDLAEPEELTADEAAAVFGGRRSTVAVRQEKVVKQLKKRAARRIQRIITQKNIIRLARLKKGKYIVKYKAQVNNTKKTVTRNNFSQANRFNI